MVSKPESKTVSDAKQALAETIKQLKAELEDKNRKFEKLRIKLEHKMAQDKVMKSLFIARKMAHEFADIVRLIDEIGSCEQARRELDKP